MADETKTVKLNTCRETSDFDLAVTKFVESYGESFAILYSPSECFLLKVGKDGDFQSSSGEISPKSVFEARIFNGKAELRWFNDNGKGVAVTLSETDTEEKFGGEICLTNPQKYLLWGEVSPTNQANGDWTEFAEARIGKFHVPIKTTSRAHFTAIEYLCEFADGNVAVIDERLTGISEVK